MTKKKLLVVARLYTGLETSLEKRLWEPEGVPTFYNFVNRASEVHDVILLLTCKDSGKTYTSGWKTSTDHELHLDGLPAKVVVLSGVAFFGGIFPRKLQ